MGKRVTWLKSREDVVFFLYEEIGVGCTMSTLFFECFQHFVGGRWPCQSSLSKCNEGWLLQELIGKHSHWSL